MVTDDRPAHVAHIAPHKTPAQFEADLQYLAKHYQVIGYDEVRRRRESKVGEESRDQRPEARGIRRDASGLSSGVRPAVVLTFDDGFRECFEVVRPLLLKHGLPAVFFITTDFLDNRRLFYRNKVSLCLERLTQLAPNELRAFADKCQQQALVKTPSRGEASTNGSAASALRSWLLSLTHSEETTIDAVCDLLEIDCEAFLETHRPYLTTEEIKKLAEDGFTIGAHSKSHARLSLLRSAVSSEQLAVDSQQSAVSRKVARQETNVSRSSSPGPSPLDARPSPPAARPSTLDSRLWTLDTLTSEIVDSCRMIASLIGKSAVPFAFPFSGDGVSRERLREIREQYPEVELIFDRRGFRQDADFIVHRIIADHPPTGEAEARSTVPSLIRREYLRQAREVLVNRKR